jgi:formate dehydrogenase iron-sulfur subunit
MTQHEAELTSGFRVERGQPYGFFTDTTLCIGCKACEVACKQWNSLPADNFDFLATSYDNTRSLGATTWRHVKFIEQAPDAKTQGGDPRWLFLSDICKHCENAGCLEACPTGAITRTEFGTVVIQQDICNGCNGVSLRQLHAWHDQALRVDLEYRGAPDMGALAVRLRPVTA